MTIGSKITKSVKPDEYFNLILTGVNPAHTSLKISAVSKEIYTPIPEVLKALPFNLTVSIVRSNNFQKSIHDLDTLVKTKLRKLSKIKAHADSLHRATLYKPDQVLADSYFKKARLIYTNLNANVANPLFEREVLDDIQFIKSLKSITQAFIKVHPSYESSDISMFSRIATLSQEFEKNDYKLFISYLFESSKVTNNQLTSKEILAEKDLIELKIVLLDTYSKDTLPNERRTVYTAAGISFGMSFQPGLQ